MKHLLTIVALLSAIIVTAAPSPDYSKIRSTHPRIILKNGDVEAVRQKVETDEAVRTIHLDIEDRATRMLIAQPSVRKKIGKRLLGVSRKVLERVAYCSYIYLLEGDENYARRAEAEMLAAASFTDWNPSHFLDVAEMTAAMAIGYDWLYDYLSPESRRIIEDAIIEKGLRAAKTKMGWYKTDNNWNQVCNAGMVMGAVAVYDRIPDEAKAHIERALKSNPIAQKCYGPDGVYPEGFGYWEYGTTFEVLLIETLRTAFGSSFELEKMPGFIESARFMNFMQGPSGEVFNFADCGNTSRAVLPLLHWFALESGDMSILWQDRKRITEEDWVRGIDRLAPVSMLFAARCDLKDVQPIKEQFWYGRGGQPLFCYRSGFAGSNDSYLAAKGGSPSSNHGHMDSGSFVYEWGGERWAYDLGSQGYHSLESKGLKIWNRSQKSDRWKVYRLNNFPHNTLTVNERIHLVKGNATMVEVYDSPKKHGAKFDMSTVLPCLSSAFRTIYIDNEHCVTCIDKVVAGDDKCRIRWNMTTHAKAEIVDDRHISLKQNGKEIIVRISSPSNAKAYIMSNDPRTSYDVKNKNSHRIGFALDIPAGKAATIKVELIPQK